MKKQLLITLVLLSFCLAATSHATNPGVKTGFLTIDRDQIYYEVSGVGFPVVLVSGVRSSWETVEIKSVLA